MLERWGYGEQSEKKGHGAICVRKRGAWESRLCMSEGCKDRRAGCVRMRGHEE